MVWGDGPMMRKISHAACMYRHVHVFVCACLCVHVCICMGSGASMGSGALQGRSRDSLKRVSDGPDGDLTAILKEKHRSGEVGSGLQNPPSCTFRDDRIQLEQAGL